MLRAKRSARNTSKLNEWLEYQRLVIGPQGRRGAYSYKPRVLGLTMQNQLLAAQNREANAIAHREVQLLEQVAAILNGSSAA